MVVAALFLIIVFFEKKVGICSSVPCLDANCDDAANEESCDVLYTSALYISDKFFSVSK
jgi:hypothetical protein